MNVLIPTEYANYLNEFRRRWPKIEWDIRYYIRSHRNHCLFIGINNSTKFIIRHSTSDRWSWLITVKHGHHELLRSIFNTNTSPCEVFDALFKGIQEIKAVI